MIITTMITNINKLARLALYMLCFVTIIASSATISATPLPDSEEEIFKSAANMPKFPGGDEALMKFISDNIRWLQETCAQGKVIVQFVVEKDGSVGEVKVVRRIDPALDREAVRVCKSLPNFYPATNFVGEPVRVWYTLPVTFKIQVPKE